MGKVLKWWQVTIKVFLHIKTIQMLTGKETSDIWATTAPAHIPFSSSTIKSGYFNTSDWFMCAVVADIEKDGKFPFFPSYQLLWTQMTATANLPYDYRFGSSLQFGNYPRQHKPELSGCQVTWNLPGRIPSEKTEERAWMRLGVSSALRPSATWAAAGGKERAHPQFVAVCYQISFILAEVKQR